MPTSAREAEEQARRAEAEIRKTVAELSITMAEQRKFTEQIYASLREIIDTVQKSTKGANGKSKALE